MLSVLQLKPGTVIGGDYQISVLIARGGMGAVYVAEQLSTECSRAIKVMHPELLDDAKARERFKQEARICARIDSDHVVKVIGSGIDDSLGAPWLAMELIKGEDLQSFVAARGWLPRFDALEIFRQMCHGLGAAHQMGVVHRDLKLQNVLIAPASRSGSLFTVKVLDFGISKLIKEDSTSDTTAAGGSPRWMAPEQAYNGKLSTSTDIWPLGLMAFKVLTGANYWVAANKTNPPVKEVLFEVLVGPLVPASDRAQELGAQALPNGFNAWFARAVVRDPAARFKNATEAFGALAPVLSSVENEAPTRTVTKSEPPSASLRPMNGAGRSAPPMVVGARAAASAVALAVSEPERHKSLQNTQSPQNTQSTESTQGLGYALSNGQSSGVREARQDWTELLPDEALRARSSYRATPERTPTDQASLLVGRVKVAVYIASGVFIGALLGASWRAYSNSKRETPETPTTLNTHQGRQFR